MALITSIESVREHLSVMINIGGNTTAEIENWLSDAALKDTSGKGASAVWTIFLTFDGDTAAWRWLENFIDGVD